MGHLPKIVPAILTPGVTRSVDETIDDGPGMLQIGEGSQLVARLRLLVGAEIGPRRRDQRTGTVRQHQDQIKMTLPAHPAEHRQRPATEWVTLPDDRHLRRKVLQVGSVSPSRSTGSTIHICSPPSADSLPGTSSSGGSKQVWS